MAAARNSGGTRVYMAIQSFVMANEDGHAVVVPAGQRVREGHPILKGRENLFKLDDTVWEVPGK